MLRVTTVLTLAIATGAVAACGSASDDRAPSPLTAPTAPAATSGSDHTAHSSGTVVDGASHHGDVALTPEAQQQIAQLRARMAAFHNFDKAVAAGYSVPAPAPGVCLSDPVRGGMGFHYTRGDTDLIGDGEVNLFEPEFLVYAPKPNGGTRFAALDYFVPGNTWPHADPPSLLGVPFAWEEGFQAWVLHIWLFWPNPAGMFENYNPDVPLC